MARKEKKASSSASATPTTGLVSVGLVCLFVVAAGSGYIWNKSQIHTLGTQIRQYEIRLEEAKRRRMALDRAYAAMCSPTDLDARVKRMKLELGPPQPDQIVRLYETPLSPEEKLFAQRPQQEGSN